MCGLSGLARSDIKGNAIAVGTRVVSDLPNLFCDIFQEHTMNVSPLYMGARFEIGMNLGPALLHPPILPPFIPSLLQPNLEGKGQLHREHGWWPQIDVVGGGWTCLLPMLVPSDAGEDGEAPPKPSFYGFNAGLTIARSLDPRLRFFVAYNFAQLRAKMDMSSLKDDETSSSEEWDFIPDEVNFGKTSHYVVLGAELLRSPKKRLIPQIEYGFISHRIVPRLVFASKKFSTSLIFFPEGYSIMGLGGEIVGVPLPPIVWTWGWQVRF